MICQKCGFENIPGERLCAKCQHDLSFRALDSQMININDLKLVEEEQQAPAHEEAGVSKSRSYKKLLVLLVVLAMIAGALAVFVRPVYETHVRAEIISEVISATRIKVERYAREHRSWPMSVSEIKTHMPERAKGKISIEIDNGVIELVISDVPGKKVRFSPSVNDRGYIVWKCDHGGVSQDYLPAICARDN